MIEFQYLNKRQLDELVHSEAFTKMPNLPISAHRAVSHLRNPRLQEDDPLLILAWSEGEMVGYLGVMPELFFLDHLPAQRCGWLTCLWVSDRHRGKSIAKQLLTRGVDTMEGRVLLTEYTPESRQLYDRLGLFADMHTRSGIRLYYRLELHKILPPKRTVFEQIKPLLRVADSLGNTLVDTIARFQPGKSGTAKWEYVEAVSPEIQRFIDENQHSELFRRGQNELNWAIKNPWVLAAPPDEMSRRYHFSSVDRSFDFVCVKVCDAEMRLQAFLIFAKRDRTLKLPCCYLSEGSAKLAAEVIDWHIRHWSINTFSTFHTEMVQYYRTNRTFALHKKALKRIYIASKGMAESVAGYTFDIQDGDGDCFFT